VLLVGCGTSSHTAYLHEQRRAERDLRGALDPDEHLPPPVCMRFPPSGPPIVAVVLGRQNLHRVEAVFRSLRLTATFEISSLAVYEAHLAGLAREVRGGEPHGYTNLRVGWKRFGFFPLPRGSERDFEPLCPRVEIGIHAKGSEPTKAELTWTESMVRRYGSDYVSIFYGEYGFAA
jgi:hypothetical protein